MGHPLLRVPLAVLITGLVSWLIQSAGIYWSIQGLLDAGIHEFSSEQFRVPVLLANVGALVCFFVTGWKLVRPLSRRQALASACLVVAYSLSVLGLEQLGQRISGMMGLFSLSQLLYIPLNAQVNFLSLCVPALEGVPGSFWGCVAASQLLALLYLPFAQKGIDGNAQQDKEL